MATIKKILSPKTEEPKAKGASSAVAAFLKNKDVTHYNEVVPKEIPISTGSLILDSDIKIRSGQVISLVGKGAELGKSSQAFVFAENYMNTLSNAKTMYIKAEGRLSQEMKWKSGLKFVLSPDEWEAGTVFVLCSNLAGEIFDLIEDTLHNAHEAGEHICFIIDSLDGLILKDDSTKKISDNGKVAGVPLLTKMFFRHCALPISHYDSLCILLSQYSAQIKASEYAPTAPNQGSSSGGSSKQHQSDYVFDYNKVNQGDLILEDENSRPSPNNRVLGKKAKITILKSASGVTWQTYEVPIRKADENHRGAKQIWVEKEVADLIVAFEMVKKSASWFTFSSDILEEAKQKEVEVPEKVQGMNGIYKLLEEPKVYEFFAAKIKEMISDE